MKKESLITPVFSTAIGLIFLMTPIIFPAATKVQFLLNLFVVLCGSFCFAFGLYTTIFTAIVNAKK